MGAAAALGVSLPEARTEANAQGQGRSRPVLDLRLRATTAQLRENEPLSPVWILENSAPAPDPSFAQAFDKAFTQGDELQLKLANDLPVPAALNWRGLAGQPQMEPLLAQPALAAGQTATIVVPLRHAGTVLCDARMLQNGAGFAMPATPLRVMEKEPVQLDQDRFLMIEDWHLRPDGSSAPPGSEPTTAVFTINGQPGFDIPVRSNERLRLRFINACHRAVIAVKIDDHEVRVMSIDSQPAEPFLARNSQLVLAPGTRIDAFIDATGAPSTMSSIQLHDGVTPRPIARLTYAADGPVRSSPLAVPQPLPSNGLPAKLDLQGAVRIELPLDLQPNASNPWMPPESINTTVAPAFGVKRGRTTVLTLKNQSAAPIVFHLHGHHFRLLDRLDDGWKPFWLDTLIVEAQQTQRIAFLAEYAGAWLIEAMGTAWEAPRLIRWYVVE